MKVALACGYVNAGTVDNTEEFVKHWLFVLPQDERTTRVHTVLSASGLTGAFNTVLGGTYTSMLEEGGTALKDRCEARV